MNEGLISSDIFRGSDSGVMEGITDIDFGLLKCDMDSTRVNAVDTSNSSLGLVNIDRSGVVSNKKRQMDINLNEMDNERNELNFGDSVQVDGERLGIHKAEIGLFDCYNMRHGIDSVSSDVGCVTDLSGVSLEEKIEDYNVETVVTSGIRKRSECASEKERNSRITIDVNDYPDIHTNDKMKKEMDSDEVGYVKDLLGVSLEEKVEGYEEAYSETIVVTSGLRESLEIVAEKERNSEGTIMVQIDVNDDPNIDKIKKEELDLVSDEVGFVRDPLGVSLEEKIENYEETNIEAINGTSGPRKKLESVSREKMNSKSTFHGKIDVNDDLDKDTIVWKRRRGGLLKKRDEERDVEEKVKVSAGDYAHMKTVVDTRGPKKKRTETIAFMKRVDVNDGPDIDIICQRRDRDRASIERYVKSDIKEKYSASASDFTNVKAVVGTSGPKIKFEKLPKRKGKPVNTFKKRTVVDDDSDMEVIVPKKKREPPKERKIDGIIKEKLRVSSCVKKSDYLDNAGDEEEDEETVVNVSGSNLERETGREKNELDDSQRMECGEDKQKAEKGRRGRKRKLMKNSVQELDNGACKKKGKETSFDDESEGVGRILSRCNMKNKSDISSYKITERKTRDEIIHLSKKKKMNGEEGRPLKGQGKSGSFKIIDGLKQNKDGLRKKDVNVLSQKDIKGSNFVGTSDGEGKTIILEQRKKKNREEKQEGTRGITPKQLIKNHIKDMLVNAGWRIDQRPRNGKENVYDSVYVCPKGRGYWSLTLAYKTLKQEVENGKTVSNMFVPIAEDEWNSLLRISRKKSGLEQNSKNTKVISQKKILKKKIAKEKLKKSNGKERKNKKRLALLARASEKGLDLNGKNFLPYEGRLSLFSWMIGLGTLPLGVKVKTMNASRTNVLLEGKVMKNGIHCDCCSKIFDLADFDFHSGNLLGQPLQSIFLDDNVSLLQCLKDSWTKYEESTRLGFHYVDIDGDDPNDDTCNMCGDGGNLICCDSCPSAIHKKCLGLQQFPSGDWNCPYCSCKFCGLVGKYSLDQGNNCDTPAPALRTCRLCEEKYHLLCVQGKNTAHDEPNSSTFCGQKCQEIFDQLEGLLGVRHEMEEGFSWMLIQHSDENLDISSLSGAKKIECNAKLAVAWSIMDECFLPIVHQRSTINMIRNVVFSCGSNFRRLNYTGFFIAILEKGNEIISAASLRIHGNLLAEMPFIGTRHAYRRQGMCRRLLNAIETALSSLNVEKLVLPAIPELQQTWTSVFGFMPLEDSHKEEMKYMNMIAFPGVDMLQKPIVKPLIGLKNLSSATDKSIGTADVATICNLTSQVSNLSSNGPSDMSFELANCQDYITNNDDNIEKEYAIAPSEDASQIGNSRDLDESNNPGNFYINCEMKNHHSSDVKEIADCGLNGEVSAINQSRDQLVPSNHGASTRALVLV